MRSRGKKISFKIFISSKMEIPGILFLKTLLTLTRIAAVIAFLNSEEMQI